MKPTRRSFLKITAGTPLAAIFGAGGARLLALVPQAPGTDQFPYPHVIRYDSHCFTLNERDTFVYSAAFHYPRCPRTLWQDRLAKLKAAGYNTIETYIFWNYHEPEEGHADLGEFEAFIGAVKQAGFWMIARPGPYVCAEWDAGGFPHWVIARRFPLRSADPQSISTSKHWFDQVMPVIVRHQITRGGPIIMVQVENEYDYWKGPSDANKEQYVRALAGMAWDAGVNVPLITCWTKPARDNADPAMARVMDTCNFYPRWQIAREVPPALEKLRREEPSTPLGITELQGGWFSEFGGKLSVDQDGVNGAQYSMLTKTTMALGVTYFSTYMAFGGTNFDWAAKNLTTTYDYAAPLREPGGLWEKFYAARGVGAFLNFCGPVLARAQASAGNVQSTNPNVSVFARETNQSGAVFVRENANAEQHFKFTFPDPNSPTRRAISIPREGDLVIGPRETKALPVQAPVPGGVLRYTTAEILTAGNNLGRDFVILYDAPGRLVEVGLATRDEPHVEGETDYQYYDPEYESVVIGTHVTDKEKFLLLNNHQLVVLLPREQALRTWVPEFPPSVVPGVFEKQSVPIPFISDAALAGASGHEKRRLWVDLYFRPGEHEVAALVPPVPEKGFVDGAQAEFQYDRHWQVARMKVSTPPAPTPGVALNRLRYSVEKFDLAAGSWLNGPAKALEDLGAIPYGYVKYRAEFDPAGATSLFISAFPNGDAKKVFLNGRPVPEGSNNKKQTEFALAKYVKPGTNQLEIAYELFGTPNFGPPMAELRGIESVGYGADAKTATPISSWQIQRFPAAMRGREVDPEFSFGGWKEGEIGAGGAAAGDPIPAFAWCRTEFTLPPADPAWFAPLNVTFEAERDAILYLNGKFVGRYVTAGPQKEFYLPEPYLFLDGKRQNVLTIVLAYIDGPQAIRTLRVAPYEDFALRRTRVEFSW